MEVSWGYVAGFFDGEGNIQIKLPSGKSTSKGICIKFGQKKKEPLIAIKNFFSDQGIQRICFYDYRGRGKGNNYFVLAISNKRDAKLFLENIEHLSLRKEEINQGLSFIETLSKRFDRPFNAEEKERIRTLYIGGRSREEIAALLKCGKPKVDEFLLEEFDVTKLIQKLPISKKCPFCGGRVERHGSRMCRKCFLSKEFLRRPEVFKKPLEAWA